jgi:hypothetical protein
MNVAPFAVCLGTFPPINFLATRLPFDVEWLECNRISWRVEFANEFDPEFDALERDVRVELLAHLRALKERGPALGRPYVDSLNGSKHANMKELRFEAAHGVWRVAFAFDPDRRAIILVAGDKTGTKAGRFYRRLIPLADARFDQHLERRRSGHGPHT